MTPDFLGSSFTSTKIGLGKLVFQCAVSSHTSATDVADGFVEGKGLDYTFSPACEPQMYARVRFFHALESLHLESKM